MKKGHILLLLAIVGLGAFLRFYAITEIPPGLYPDEAMNGNNALEALATGQFKVFYPENNGREGLFINLQAISLAILGNEPWALRVVSAFFGTLTIIGIYLLAYELTQRRAPALLAAFFLAASYWHVNFSRIGFRAILVPFFATFAMYFLLKGLRTGKILHLVAAGIFAGLGFHTYIAFRFMAFVFAVPIVWYIWRRKETAASCLPCAILLFLFVIFVVTLPLGVYFLQNPQDFLNRAGEISIFSAQSPLKEFGKSTLLTLGMLFSKGDCNWRHNFNCQPALHPLIAVLFLIGAAVAARRTSSLSHSLLLVWVATLSLPAILTREGLPHALRSIGMIPPVMILASLGVAASSGYFSRWLKAQHQKWPAYTTQLLRIKKELILFGALALLAIPFMTYQNYFVRWAAHPEAYAAFDTGTLNLGRYLTSLPQDIDKYVIVNTKGVIVRGIPMPAQTVMFATDTFRDEERREKNLFYLTRGEIEQIRVSDAEKVSVAVLDGGDRDLIRTLGQKFPALKVRVPGDFVALQNY